MKNQKVIIVVAGIVLLALAGVGYYTLSVNKSSKPPQAPQLQELQKEKEETISTLSPEDIGLTLTAGVDKKRVIMEIANTATISSLDYELSYTSRGDIPRGVIGNIEVTSKDKLIKKELVLGTCSDVCHYDEEVSDIKLILKVTKTDSKVYSVEKTLET